MKSILLSSMIFLCVLTAMNSTKAQVQYQVIDLGTLGGTQSFATSINDSGQVVGYSSTGSGTRAFLWKDGVMTNLGTLGGPSRAFSINNFGQVAGTADNPGGQYRAFRWVNGVMTDLGTLGGSQSHGYGINNSGHVVGYAENSSNNNRPFHWTNGSMIDLGTLGGNHGWAFGINDNGIIVGSSRNANGDERAFVWQNGNMADIGALGFDAESEAKDINSVGQVVGISFNSGGDRAFIWQNGNMTNLGNLGFGQSQAYGINDSGYVVGTSAGKAFLWQNGVMTDLNARIDTSSGWILYLANDINNAGQIVGDGILNGQSRAFLLTPIVRYPVLIVPGIAGTYSSNTETDLGWILERGSNPWGLQIDPLGKVYHDIIETFENIGYERDKNFFIVNYDWRLPPGPVDNTIDGHIDGLSGASITNNQFNYGVDYLGWFIKKACERWRELYNEELDSIDVIAHSTGGLVTRTYIQSNAYGDVYDPVNNYYLPKIRNFVMIGVPNRGASKAWNPIHDNWIADPVYRFVLSKILNRAYQKVLQGLTITGPDYSITLSTILDSLGNPSKTKFISQYVPTIRGLLATYDFINFGSGYTGVNNDPEQRNIFLLDLNDGLDLNPSANPNEFLDSSKVSVIYGTGNNTKSGVQQRSDFMFLAIQSFTDWIPSNASSGTIWFKDIEGSSNGDGTVPTISSAGQFENDNRANKIPFSTGDHTALVSLKEVQSGILNLLNVYHTDNEVSTSASASFQNVWNVISDPVELIITDGFGNRLGYTNSTGALTEIPNSIWFGNTDGTGYVFGSVQEPVNLQLTGLGEDYYVMVSVEDSGGYGGVVLEGFLGLGEIINYQIKIDPLSVNPLNSFIPDQFELAQNYPNPFNPITTISWQSPAGSWQTLKVYDLLGREVAVLVDEYKPAGRYEVEFNASHLSSGIYLYTLHAGEFTSTKKLLLLK